MYEKREDNIKFDLLPKTDEEYISMSYGCLRFIDSYRFLQTSLDKLASTLLADKFTYVVDDDLKKKLAYPYEYCKSIDDYNLSCTALRREDYSSHLRECDEESINRTNDVIKRYNLNTMKDLTMLYMKNDVDLLADVFENFIELGMKTYKINPCHYYSLPGYTWDCGLKFTGIKLQNIQNVDMLLFIENCIRGGISSVMGDRYVESCKIIDIPGQSPITTKKGSLVELAARHIPGAKVTEQSVIYVDANNLYGWGMSQCLPYDNLELKEVDEKDQPTLYWHVMNTAADSEIGYYLEVDLEYPAEIKFKTKNLPFCPIKRKVDKSELSEYSKSVMPDNHIPQPKLICDQYDKHKYILDYRMLQFYVGRGMKLKKIHRVLSFKQKAWLKPYIDHNTSLRAKAKTDFEKDFYKLMNNAFYGKTMENVRERVNVRYYKNDEQNKIINSHSQLTFKREKLFDSFRIHHHTKQEVLFNKPIYIGAAVLELSKMLMYQYYYDVLQPHFGETNLQLHYMDTDSFVLSIKCNDLVEQLLKLEDYFDFSNLDKDHILFSNKNKKVVGKFKIETGPSLTLDRFVALKPKIYCFVVNDNECGKIKGVSKQSSAKISFDEYKNTLYNGRITQATNTGIRSDHHNISLQTVKKTALSASDDKRFYISSTESVPHGYYDYR